MKKIVAIDDEPTVLKCLESALESHGYSLFVTSDPDEGMDTIMQDKEVMLVLLDVRMPKINGFDLYKKIREERKLPVLFVTAYPKSFTTESDDVVSMWQDEFADGTTDIIYKPFGLEMLFEKVEGLIGHPEEDGE